MTDNEERGITRSVLLDIIFHPTEALNKYDANFVRDVKRVNMEANTCLEQYKEQHDNDLIDSFYKYIGVMFPYFNEDQKGFFMFKINKYMRGDN